MKLFRDNGVCAPVAAPVTPGLCFLNATYLRCINLMSVLVSEK